MRIVSSSPGNVLVAGTRFVEQYLEESSALPFAYLSYVGSAGVAKCCYLLGLESRSVPQRDNLSISFRELLQSSQKAFLLLGFHDCTFRVFDLLVRSGSKLCLHETKSPLVADSVFARIVERDRH